jgi:uncharacterized membrane protein YjfL (UPF0719 family)
MPQDATILLTPVGLVAMVMDTAIGFAIFWLGQFLYQKLFRRMALNEELFVRDNPAVAIALVGYYLGLVTALTGVLAKPATSFLERLNTLAGYGVIVIVLMLMGAWVGDRLILRHFDAAREIQQEQNIGAAAVEAGFHIANGLILSAALGGQDGIWWVGILGWAIGIAVLICVSFAYPTVAAYNVFGEICKRNNPAAGVALAGLLIATGNIAAVAFSPKFRTLPVGLLQYGLFLMVGLVALAIVRWIADWVLVPGVKISDEIVNQSIPNVGAGLIEAFSYIAGSFLIASRIC